MNPNLIAFAQMAQQARQVPPQGQVPMPSRPMPAPVPVPQAAPNGAPPSPQMSPQGQPPMQPQGQAKMTPQQMANLGRFGDKLIAHLTPGEIEVPPQVQTPKVLATLKRAFHDKGVNQQQFTAGSPVSSHNPATGMPEYNFLSALLPIAGTVAGSFFGGPLGGAIGGAAGGALAGGIGGGGIGGALEGGALGGLGGYLGGDVLGGVAPDTFGGGAGAGLFGGAADPAAQAATQVAMNGTGPGVGAAVDAAGGLTNSAPIAPSANSGGLTNFIHNNPGIAALGAGALGMFALNALNGQPKQYSSPLPPGFNTPMPPPSQLPPWNQAIGQNTYNGPRPNFTNYNPFQVGQYGGYNFYS